MIIEFEEPQVSTIDGDYIPTDEELAELFDEEADKPNCVTCDHFGKCEGCEKKEEE